MKPWRELSSGGEAVLVGATQTGMGHRNIEQTPTKSKKIGREEKISTVQGVSRSATRI
jgi:hypothetical protein